MIVVTKIETFKTERDDVFNYRHQRDSYVDFGADHIVPICEEREVIFPEKFINFETKEELWLGMTKEVNKTLGYPMDALKNCMQRNNELYTNNRKLSIDKESLLVHITVKENEIKNMSLFQIIKFWYKNKFTKE